MNSKDKGELRKYWKSQYSQFRSSFPTWSREICHHILSNPKFQKSRKIAIFYPRDWEVNLIPLWEARPQDCSFPKTDTEAWDVKFYSIEAPEVPFLALGPGGVWEPVPDKEREIKKFESDDLILVPGLAFDSKGMRVGSGKGVYDRFLAGSGKLAQKWGVAFSPQVTSTLLATQPHDVPMDALVTEKGFIYF